MLLRVREKPLALSHLGLDLCHIELGDTIPYFCQLLKLKFQQPKILYC